MQNGRKGSGIMAAGETGNLSYGASLRRRRDFVTGEAVIEIGRRMNTQDLIDKIVALPAERIAEIEDFVDFIHLREQARALTRAATAASEPAFAAIWNNSDDSAYDAL